MPTSQTNKRRTQMRETKCQQQLQAALWPLESADEREHREKCQQHQKRQNGDGGTTTTAIERRQQQRCDIGRLCCDCCDTDGDNANDPEKQTAHPMMMAHAGGNGIFHFLSILLFAAFFLFSVLPIPTNGQALSDPSTQYVEGRMAGRRIWWCPSGYGYLAYCPQPTDWDNYNWCCTFPYMGSWKPSCCPFAIPTGAVITVIIASIVMVGVLVGLSCWCCWFCPLYKQLYESEEEEGEFVESEQQQQQT